MIRRLTAIASKKTAISAVLTTCLLGGLSFAQTPAGKPSTPSQASPAQAAALVNLNTATSGQLEALPGIGKATADRIIEYRQKSGSFKKVEDLMNVRGIGEKSFLKLKPLVTVSTPKAN